MLPFRAALPAGDRETIPRLSQELPIRFVLCGTCSREWRVDNLDTKAFTYVLERRGPVESKAAACANVNTSPLS